MGKKKPFIDRKSASTFHLMHRSQRDVSQQHLLEEGDTDAAGMILWPSPANDAGTNAQVLGTADSSHAMKEWRDRLRQVGLLEEGPNAPDAHVKEITGTGTFFDATGRLANANEDWRAVDSATTAEDLDMLEVKGQLDGIPLSDALDGEMAAMLSGDVELEGFEELNDEFVFDAAKEPDESGEKAFDYDEHIRKLMEKARKEREGGAGGDRNNAHAKRDADFFARLKPLHERQDEEEEDDDSFAGLGSELGAADALTAMTTPGVVPKLGPDEEKALCDKFAETLLEYDSDEIGDDPYEEIGGDRQLEGDAALEAALDDFLEEKQGDVLIHGDRGRRQGGSGYAVLVGKQMVSAKELDPAEDEDPAEKPPVQEVLAHAQARLGEPHVKPPEEDVLIDGKSYFSEKIRNPWDCESILSTYSNLDNNPVTIGPGGGRRRKPRNNKKKPNPNEPVQQIELSNKTGLPLGVLNSRHNDDDDDDDGESNYFDDSTAMSVNRGLARKKNETAEEKRARKAALKQERQMARIQKKVTREVFQEEFAKRSTAIEADDVAGKTVFRYS